MSHNPNRGVGNKSRNRRARKYDPHAGHKRAGPETLQGVDFGDIRSREPTGRGWKIVHFQGEDFEMIYELISAGSTTGKIRHETMDRSFRVLEGSLYVLLDKHSPIEIRRNQAFSIPKGITYELCPTTSSDVEVLFCQGHKYDEGVEIIEAPAATRTESMSPVPQTPYREAKVDGAPAAAAAAEIRKERMARQRGRTPVPRKNPDGSPAGHGRAPLAGQAATGTNLKPVGAGGYEQ